MHFVRRQYYSKIKGDIILYKAVGYHGTTKDAVQNFLEEDGIDCTYKMGKEPFLGGGFYLWRDSYKRALKWSENHAGDIPEDQSVLEVDIECHSEEMLNFTSTVWNNEQVMIKAYLSAVDTLKEGGVGVFYFGHFIDSFIQCNTNIKLVTMHDLTNKLQMFNIKDPADIQKETNFAFGDIQLCVKDPSVMVDRKEALV